MNNWKYCTPEQGKRLVELGIEAGELMHYKKFDYNDETFVWTSKLQGATKKPATAPAFDVAELGVLLPHGIIDNSDEDKPAFYPIKACKEDDETFNCMWLYNRNFNCKTEAQARANLLIYLLENNHVTAAECNARLKAVNL